MTPRERLATPASTWSVTRGRGRSSTLRCAGGADIVQLRDKTLDDDGLIEAAKTFRAAADAHGALFILNDRPDLAEACPADGVHVGQDDATPARGARAAWAPKRIVGRSIHAPAQADAADADPDVDYLAVGPVHATPTKPGRPAAGLEYVAYAARRSRKPWFAIGGLHRLRPRRGERRPPRGRRARDDRGGRARARRRAGCGRRCRSSFGQRSRKRLARRPGNGRKKGSPSAAKQWSAATPARASAPTPSAPRSSRSLPASCRPRSRWPRSWLALIGLRQHRPRRRRLPRWVEQPQKDRRAGSPGVDHAHRRRVPNVARGSTGGARLPGAARRR